MNAKWCFVPTCLNSTKNTVNKWFVPIPVNPKRRETWFKAVNRNYCVQSERSTLYCCSDHFNLDEDVCSSFERNGEVVIKLKKSIVPRIKKVTPGSLKPNPQDPKKTIQLNSKKEPVTLSPGLESLQSTSDGFVCLIDNNSSNEDEDVDVVGVVASDISKKNFLGLKESSSTTSPPKNFLGKGRSLASRSSITKSPRSKSIIINSGNVSDQSTNFQEVLRTLFTSLRRSIPSIASQQSLTREQILDEAIEFIVQMRNKSDRRQSSMNFIMENNALLTAKIQHLEHLIALHEKNEIVLTKEIVNRRLGAVTALSWKMPKTRGKR